MQEGPSDPSQDKPRGCVKTTGKKEALVFEAQRGRGRKAIEQEERLSYGNQSYKIIQNKAIV